MIKLLTTTILGISTLSVAYGSGDMFLDLHRDSNVSSLNDRHYSASLGRFLTPDRAKISISEYTYASGNIIRNSDPSGLGLWGDFKRMIKGTKITASDFPAHFERGFDRDVARDGATKLKGKAAGSHKAPVKSNQETAPIMVAVIPEPEIGISTPILIHSTHEDLENNYETSDNLVLRLRNHQNPESNQYSPEYSPKWNRPSIYTEDIDFDITRVKGHTANISELSDDDLGEPAMTSSHRANSLNGTKITTFNPLGSEMDMTSENTQTASFNEETGLSGSLTKNKKVLIASGVVVLSVGGAALTAYMLLKNKQALAAPQPVSPCPGVVQHPAPC